MNTSIADQLAALQRIAGFSVALRGHELGPWNPGEDSALASCTKCGAAVRVYFPALQPEMDGAALNCECDPSVVAERAA